MAKILIIEDDLRFEGTYNFLFEKEGHQVVRAHDGEEGLALAESENPDIILLDMMMPKLNGLEFLQRYDVKGRHPGVKVVVFSNMQNDEYIHQAMELGATKYEIKATYTPKQLAALVESLV